MVLADASNNKFLYFVIGILVAAIVGFSIYAYQKETEPKGVQLSIGENGVKVEAN
jgi:hypothetical protein